MSNLGQALQFNWDSVIESSIQDVVNGLVGQYNPAQVLAAIHQDWGMFIDQYGAQALFQAMQE